MKLIDSINDLIFTGRREDVSFSFIKNVITSIKQVSRLDDGTYSELQYKDILPFIHSNKYFDLGFSQSLFAMEDKVVGAYIELSANDDIINLLFFFDITELKITDTINAIDFLKEWTIGFCQEYGFGYFKYQMDNANDTEYYFDSYGPGPLSIK